VWFGHDVRAGAIAEGALGAGRGAADFLLVAVGTGIGGAIVHDGSALRGAGGLAGEIGHIVVVPDGRLCPCGGHGCAEAYASGPAIVAAYGDATLGAADVVARAAAGDARARVVWAEAIGALATAVAAGVALLDPALVVVGGGLALAGEQLRDPLAHAVQARLAFRDAPPLALAQLDDRAACLGAGIAAWALVS
jgi:glucokinase